VIPVNCSPRPLNICLISEELPPETGWGGIGTYTYNLAHGLAQLGHSVHVIARTWGEERMELAGSVNGNASAGGAARGEVIVHRIPIAPPSWRRGTYLANLRFPQTREICLWNLKVARVIDRIDRRERLDVIETPEYHAQGLLASFAQPRIPVVVKLHTPAFLCRQINGGIDFGGSAWDTVLSEQAEHWLARRARVLTSPSRALAQDVTRHWQISRERVRIVPNPIDEELFAPSMTPKELSTVLYVGRLERRKGVETLIRAWPAVRSALPGARARLVGKDHESAPGGGSMKAYLKGLLSHATVGDDSVEFRDAVDRAALPPLYGAATVCVVPSRYENFPYTCLEAMACGAAVVASGVGGIAEMITHDRDGLLVPPDDPVALAAAIVRLLRDPELRRRLGQAARRTVCDRFSRAAICRQTAELYESLVH